MSFWNKVGKIVETVVEHAPAIMESIQQDGAKKQASLQKEAERRINHYERQVNQAANSSRMNNPVFARKVQEEKAKIERAKVNIYTGNPNSDAVQVNSNGDITFGGLTVEQWNRRWTSLGLLSSLTSEDLSAYNKQIGLYKAELNGQVAYVGKAIEWNNGGFRKRLRDYVRNSTSGRTHGSGRKMNEHAERLRISILIVGDSAKDVDTVIALERAMIGKLQPNWNVQHNR